MNQDKAPKREIATLGGGCFWCLEAVFAELNGVEQVVSGYAGGTVPNPSYEHVCSGKTGHAEVVQITFNPNAISFQELLQVFFTIHDPTTPDRQGYDVGTQYRSIILYHSEEQRASAEQAIAELTSAKTWDGQIVTQPVPHSVFYPAEQYHQEYFKKNPTQPYCQAIVAPKVLKVRQYFLPRMKRQGE